jgi:hypothetical protein
MIFSSGDWIALAGPAATFASLAARGLWRWRAGGADQAVLNARAQGADDVLAERLESLAGEITTLAGEVKQSNAQFHQHEIDCAKFRGETVAGLRDIDRRLGRRPARTESDQ